ncbi:PsbP-like protein 1, chloroplastic [Linum grandiflorum]
MASLQNSPSLYRTLSFFPYQQVGGFQKQQQTTIPNCGKGISFLIRAQNSLASQSQTPIASSGRRQLVGVGIIAPLVSLVEQTSTSFAAENKKGFLSVTDQKDGYSFLYPFGWQEVEIQGQDKVFKDVIEPLESVSVTMFPTSKQDIRDFGPPDQVAGTLIKKVLASPTQKTKLIQAKEQDIEGRAYYTFEFVAQAPNFTRHALSAIVIGNGKLYTLTTGAKERRWEKMKDKLQTIVESFKVVNV